MAQKVSRRDVLKYAAIGILGFAAGAAANYALSPAVAPQPAPAAPKEVPKKPIKIGVIRVLTGPGAMLFEPGQKALEMEVEKINQAGGILGRKIELVVKDSGGKADVAVDLFNKLVLEEQVEYIIGGIASAEALALAPKAEENKVLLLIEEGTTSKLFEERRYKYVFRIDNYDPEEMIGLVLQIRKYWPDAKKFAHVSADYAWGRDEWDLFYTVMKKVNPEMEVVAEAWPPFSTTDFTPHITTLLNSGADVLIINLWGGDLTTFIQQAAGYGLFKKMRAASVTGGEYVHGAGTACPDGLLMGTRYYFLYPPWERWKLNKEFNEEFRRRYPNVRKGIPGFNCNSAYAAIHALKLAIEKAYAIRGEWPETEDIIEALEGLMVPTPGGYRYFRKEDHQMLGYQVYGFTKQSPEYGFAILERVEAFPPEELAPPPGVPWKKWVESW